MRKRPEGWIPPGPAAPGGVLPAENETLDCLSGDFKIFQLKNGHRYSIDDLLVAWYLGEKAGRGEVRRHVDLGTGIGSVALLVSWLFPEAVVLGIEAQPQSAALFEKSALYNGVAERVKVINADIRGELRHVVADGKFDTATGSPPYFLAGEGKVSDRPQRGPCRFEERGGVEAYLGAASGLLKEGGLFAWVHLARLREKNLEAAARFGFGSITARDVLFSSAKPALITLFSARLGTVGNFCEEEPLAVRLSDGSFSPAYRRVREAMGYPA